MEYGAAKNLIINKYKKLNYNLVEDDDKITFEYVPDIPFVVTRRDIEEYIEHEQNFSNFKKILNECCICGMKYCEQLLNSTDSYTMAKIWLVTKGTDRIIFGNPNSDNIYAEISKPSKLFINNFWIDDNYIKIFKDDFPQPFSEPLGITQFFDWRYTIKVHNINGLSIESASNKSREVIESCLFELSYMKGLSLSIQEKWIPRLNQGRPFTYREFINDNFLPIPKAYYDANLIKYYLQGKDAYNSLIKFLSYYNVLEYFFVKVSDEQLYERLSRKINDPGFNTKEENLAQITQYVIDHKRETDETAMLKMVIKKYVDEDELIKFIKTYEKYQNEHLYSKKRHIFGNEVGGSIEKGHVFGNIASTVKTIRNALVHSSDKYDQKERYVPGFKSEEMLKKEIPLMEFLAEQIIFATATPIT